MKVVGFASGNREDVAKADLIIDGFEKLSVDDLMNI